MRRAYLFSFPVKRDDSSDQKAVDNGGLLDFGGALLNSIGALETNPDSASQRKGTALLSWAARHGTAVISL